MKSLMAQGVRRQAETKYSVKAVACENVGEKIKEAFILEGKARGKSVKFM